MFAILHALGMFVVDLFKSRSRLEAENLFLRHQLNIALRRAPLLCGCMVVTGRCWEQSCPAFDSLAESRFAHSFVRPGSIV